MNLRIQLGLLTAAAVLSVAPLGAQLVRVPPPDESNRVITISGDVGLLSNGSRYDAIDGLNWVFGSSSDIL